MDKTNATELSRNGYPRIDFRADLNEDQYRAVTADPGPALVLAGAGSGKTRTLTYRVAWLLEQGVHPRNILLLTFTNKASREMLGRVEDLSGVAPHNFWGGTFHSVGQRALRFHGEAVGLKRNYTIIDEKDAESVLSEVIKDLDPKYLKNRENPKPRVLSDIISYARNTRFPLEEVIPERIDWAEDLVEPIMQFAEEYKARKLARQIADYDDLLEYWLAVLKKDPDIAAYYQNRFQHILVDEYQDTNKLQSDIVDLIGIHHNIMAVGDDAQCIYTWRGANFENIMDFPNRHPNAVTYKIEINYRSTPQILNLANGVLASQPAGSGYRKSLRPTRPSNVSPYIVPTIDGRQQAQFIINRIDGLVAEGFSYSDITILYRAHFHALDLQMEMAREGTPFVITSGLKFFEQAHIRDLVAHLRFACNTSDSPAFERMACLLPKVGPRTAQRMFNAIQKVIRKNRSTHRPGTDSDQSGELFDGDFIESKVSRLSALTTDTILKCIPKSALDDWKDLAYTLQDIEAAVLNLKPTDAVHAAIEGWYGDFIRTIYPNWESRKDDLDSLIGFAQRYDDMSDLLSQLVLMNSETHSRSYENREEAVRLSTIHQAKGLEYPVVFVIGLADGMFPLKRAIENNDLDEERRLFYVAVTRARDELYLSYTRISASGGYGGSLSQKPSRFLEQIPPQQYEILRLPATRPRW